MVFGPSSICAPTLLLTDVALIGYGCQWQKLPRPVGAGDGTVKGDVIHTVVSKNFSPAYGGAIFD